jgi:hypothetical protein
VHCDRELHFGEIHPNADAEALDSQHRLAQREGLGLATVGCQRVSA